MGKPTPESKGPLKNLNKYGIGTEARQLWQRLIDRGFTFEMFIEDPCKYPFVWCKILAKFTVKPRSGERIDDYEPGEVEATNYYSEKPISIEFPFWLQFEDFLDSLDETYHDSIIPHMSGRTDGVPFDQPD